MQKTGGCPKLRGLLGYLKGTLAGVQSGRPPNTKIYNNSKKRFNQKAFKNPTASDFLWLLDGEKATKAARAAEFARLQQLEAPPVVHERQLCHLDGSGGAPRARRSNPETNCFVQIRLLSKNATRKAKKKKSKFAGIWSLNCTFALKGGNSKVSFAIPSKGSASQLLASLLVTADQLDSDSSQNALPSSLLWSPEIGQYCVCVPPPQIPKSPNSAL